MVRTKTAALLCALALGGGLAGCGDDTASSANTDTPMSTKPAALDAPTARGADGSISVTKAPQPGTYTVKQSGTTLVKDQGDGPKPRPAKGTIEVSPAETGADGQRQLQTRTDGDGSKVEQTLLYNDQGIFVVDYLTVIPVVNNLRTYTCKPSRPVQILPTKVGPGKEWEDRVDCEAGQISYKAKAVLEEDVVLGDGASVHTLRIDVENTIEGKGLTTRTKMSFWLAPELSMQVKTADQSDIELSVYDIERRAEDVLESAKPTA